MSVLDLPEVEEDDSSDDEQQNSGMISEKNLLFTENLYGTLMLTLQTKGLLKLSMLI